MTRPVLALLALALSGVTPGALPLAAQDKPHPLEPDDYFTIRAVGSVAPSPDGKLVAFTLTGWEDDSDDMNTDLWVTPNDDDPATNGTRLTFDPAGDSSPMWAPDGRTIYFLSARKGGDEPPTDGDTQVWKIDVDGKNLSAVTRIKGGVEAAAVTDDGSAIFYTVPREVVEDDLAGLRSKYKDLDYGHGKVKYSTLMRLDLNTWRSEELIAPDRYIRSFGVSPDGKSVAMVTDPDRNLITHEGESRVELLDVGSKKATTITKDGWRKEHPSPYGWIDAPAVSQGGKVAFTVAFDGYPAELYVYEKSGDGWAASRFATDGAVTIYDGSAHFVDGSDAVAYIGEDHGRARVYKVSDITPQASGEAKKAVVTPGDVVVFSFALQDGRPAIVSAGTPTELGDVWRVEGEKLTKLTDVNPQTKDWAFPEVQLYSWEAPDGAPVEGILELPPGYNKEKDGPLPLVVAIHGGPTASEPYLRRFRIYGRALMAAKGYAMLSPNYRGSTGYGEKFMVDLIGRENDIEVEDILAGVEALAKDGLIDPEKVGVMGWSNGGFLTNALLSRTFTAGLEGKEYGFAAASSGAGVVDQVIQWGVEDTPGHVINYMSGKLPWENPEEYVESSPLYTLNKTKTPTLIHVGGSDARVPPEHSKTLFRSLYNYLDVPAELIVYPGEPHGLMKKKHRAAKLAWDHAWFDKYLKGESDDEESDDED
ncbi:S9 family peptidase [Alienimonas californiensis]|uniref:Prolyl tripeptidyl peptidase n=1 Tax=Alienimonas californiensis TaxID=2527989 RepID=A0A517P7D9_9PLAN|nr:S9 family peptidase [Alienimonas californiensis]QDT15297.1 Prolyl tripeptidyl peptidase precursor [Alienimonas californiensis]